MGSKTKRQVSTPEVAPVAKKTKARKTKSETTEKKKSNLPVIKRPRSITQDTFAEYINSTMVNVDYRLSELAALHENGKCPYKAIQHLKSLQHELQYLSNRIAPLIKPRRKQVDKANNILMKKVNVSPTLAKFLQLGKNEQVSRSECNAAVTMYINVKDMDAVLPERQKWLKRMNPKGERSLQSKQNGSVIEPDKALSDLLDYPAYQKRVAAGKHFWNRVNKVTGLKEKVQETDDRLTYAVVQHLLAPHFKDVKQTAPAPVAAKKGGRKAAPAPVVEDEESEQVEDASDE